MNTQEKVSERIEKAKKLEAKKQKATFERLITEVGFDLALFVCCAAFDFPFKADVEFDGWDDYTAECEVGESFKDGITNIGAALEANENKEEYWHRKWGKGSPENPYSNDDYDRLDDLFKTYSSRLMAAGGMDAQQEDTLRNCCKMRLLSDKKLAEGTKDSVASAKNLNSMIQEALSSENLRRKDEHPVEKARVDGIVDALRKKYGGKVEMTKDEFMEIFYTWLRSHKNEETADAAEWQMLMIINAMRQNSDLDELQKLPKEMKFPNEVRTEFATKPNEAEIEALKYLGLS